MEDFNIAVENLYYDNYFRGLRLHDYTDEQIAMATSKADVDDCINEVKKSLYKHFGLGEG